MGNHELAEFWLETLLEDFPGRQLLHLDSYGRVIATKNTATSALAFPTYQSNRHLNECLLGVDRATLQKWLSRAFESGHFRSKANLCLDDGTYRSITLSIYPLSKYRPEAPGFSVVIAENLNAVEELAKRTQELARSNEELYQFAYVCSHDLKEPLRMVTSFLQLIEARYCDRLEKEGKEFISYAVDGARRMRRLIDDLLCYSRAHTICGKETVVDFNQVVGEALTKMKNTIEENHAEISISKLPFLFGDSLQLERLVQNLIENALKFRREDNPHVDIDCHAEEAEWVFSVADNGIGIESHHAKKIFTVFPRVHPRKDYPGNGIGLAICKKIVERHGGRIWMESNLHQGSTFYFALPR